MNKKSAGILSGIVALILLVAVGVGGRYLGNSAVTNFQRSGVTVEDVTKEIAKTSPEIFSVLEQQFPAEHAAMVAEMIALIENSETSDEARNKASRTAQNVRRKYAKYAKFAPDIELKEVLIANKNLLDSVTTQETWQVCNNVAFAGAQHLPPDRFQIYRSEIDALGSALLTALASGSGISTSGPNPPTEDDWTELIVNIIEAGATEDQLDALEAGNLSSPAYCSIIIIFLDQLVKMPGNVGHRLRASTVYEIAAG